MPVYVIKNNNFSVSFEAKCSDEDTILVGEMKGHMTRHNTLKNVVYQVVVSLAKQFPGYKIGLDPALYDAKLSVPLAHTVQFHIV